VFEFSPGTLYNVYTDKNILLNLIETKANYLLILNIKIPIFLLHTSVPVSLTAVDASWKPSTGKSFQHFSFMSILQRALIISPLMW
jgi:hypothetical protein